MPNDPWPLAVLFDFDGVIVNSEPLHCAAFQQVFATIGLTLSDDEYYRELIGFDDRGAIAHLFALRGRPIDPPLARRLEAGKAAVVQQMIDAGRVTALPGVDALVRRLAPRLPLAICSAALRPEIERMLDGIGLRPFFPVIVSAEDVDVSKPDPRCYLLTVDRLARHAGVPLTPPDCLIVEDAPTVIRNARAAGFRTLGVATSHPLSDLTAADFAVRDLTATELARHLPHLRLTS